MISRIFSSAIFPIELLLAIYICAAKIRKRSFWGVRMALSLCLASVLMVAVDGVIEKSRLIDSILSFFVTILFIGFLVFFIYDISLKDAMYCCMIGYAMQNFASSCYIFMSILLFGNIPAEGWVNKNSLLIYLLVYSVSYVGLYLLFARNLPKDGEYIINLGNSAEVFVLVVPIALVLSIIAKTFDTDPKQLLICQMYEMIACVLVLWIQYWQKKVVNLQVEMTVQERIFTDVHFIDDFGYL